MNSERLLEAFSKIGDDPDRIQQLRKIAIALAVSGKLDKGAATLSPRQVLDAVDRVKADLAKRGAIPKSKKHAEVTLEQLPDAFSDTTRFAPLGELARIEKGQTGIQQAQPGAFPLVVTAAERATCDHFDFDGSAAIIPLVSSTGHGNASINRLHYQEGKFALGTILVAVFPHDPNLISARFLFEYLSAFKEELLVARMTGTANVTLSVGRIADVPIPLICPEVQRKVDELMALCDQLEQARAGREAVRDRLTIASLARLTAPDTDAETFQSHARFALQSLPTLTTRPDQIKTLRQTILNLAVRGKLVAQDLSDEAVILPPIKQFSGASSWDKQVFIEFSQNFDLPFGWQIAPMACLSEHIVDCPHTTPKWTERGEICVRTNQLRAGTLDLSQSRFVSLETYNERIERLEPLAGDILYSREGGILGMACRIPDGVRLCLGQRLMLIRCGSTVRSTFLEMVLNSPFITEIAKAKTTGGAAPRVNMSTVRGYPIPLPPLAEQHRIVAKVDALMALCDQLETSLTTAATARSKLLNALLHEALGGALDGQTEAAA